MHGLVARPVFSSRALALTSHCEMADDIRTYVSANIAQAIRTYEPIPNPKANPNPILNPISNPMPNPKPNPNPKSYPNLKLFNE